MPIDLQSTIRKSSQFTFSSPFFNNMLGGSLSVSILITIMMILLVMIMYPAQLGTPFSVICKLFIYVFFGTLLMVFLHDGVIKSMLEQEEDEKNNNDIMRGVTIDGKDAVYGQTQMINPLNSNSTELKPQISLPLSDKSITGGGHSGGHSDYNGGHSGGHSDYNGGHGEEQTVGGVVENNDIGILGGYMPPKPKPNMYRR